MKENKDILKESASFIKDIEARLKEAISKKKKEIENELEKKIRRNREEAREKIDQIEKDFAEEKLILTNYLDIIREYENNKLNLRNQIKEQLDKTIQFQKKIEALTAQSLEELKKVSDLYHRLEELHKEVEKKTAVLKKDLEERFGIVADVLKTSELKEEELNLDEELAKLIRIKELLTSSEEERAKSVEEGKEEEKQIVGSEKEIEKEEEYYNEKAYEKEGIEPAISEEKKTKEDELLSEEVCKKVALNSEIAIQDTRKALQEYRKSETEEDKGEIIYFQKNDKIILDVEGLISALNNRLDEAKKLYLKLIQTESLKDQFFIKRQIIIHQEALRKIVLRNISMCEKEKCSLPGYTQDILNMDVLKKILDMLSMENWSDENDFTNFEKYTINLKEKYDARINPPAPYLKSIMEELGIE